jgi:subtilisin family serine protease
MFLKIISLMITVVVGILGNDCNDLILSVTKNYTIPTNLVNTELIADKFSKFNIIRMKCTNISSEDAVHPFTTLYSSILKRGDIYNVEKDMNYHTQDHPLYSNVLNSSQWGLDEIDGVIDNKYTYSLTGKGVNVYVIDSGIYPNIDIINNIDKNKGIDLTQTFIKDPFNDCLGHGTHVSSTIVGAKYGIAKDARLISVKVFNCFNSVSMSTIIKAINWIKGQLKLGDKVVINMSLGGPNSDILKQVIDEINNIAIVVAAAGNNNEDSENTSPANAPGVITVGAIDKDYNKASFSNYGKLVTIYAPGVGIEGALNKPEGTKFSSGTSMATPGVTGIVALMYQKYKLKNLSFIKKKVYAIANKGIVKGLKSYDNNVNAKTPQYIHRDRNPKDPKDPKDPRKSKTPTLPTNRPTFKPTNKPTISPTTNKPTPKPSNKPTTKPTKWPTNNPTKLLCYRIKESKECIANKCEWSKYGCFKLGVCSSRFKTNCKRHCMWVDKKCIKA